MDSLSKLQRLLGTYRNSSQKLIKLEESFLAKGIKIEGVDFEELPYNLNEFVKIMIGKPLNSYAYGFGLSVDKFIPSFLNSLENSIWFFNDYDYFEFDIFYELESKSFKVYSNSLIPWPEDIKKASYITVKLVRSNPSKELFSQLDKLDEIIPKSYKVSQVINDLYWQYHPGEYEGIHDHEFKFLLKERSPILGYSFTTLEDLKFDQVKIHQYLKSLPMYNLPDNDLIMYQVLREHVWNPKLRNLKYKPFIKYLKRKYNEKLKRINDLEKEYLIKKVKIK